MSKEELEKENAILKEIIQKALPNAFHTPDCPYSIDATNGHCECWVIEAYTAITPVAKDEPKDGNERLCECSTNGRAHLEIKDHTVSFGSGPKGCALVGCNCSGFKAKK